MISIKRLDHIQICIPTGMEEKAREFYSGVLGLEEIPKPAALVPNGGLWYTIADIQLHIGTEDEPGRSKRHPAFEVDDLELCRENLTSQGVPIKEEIPVPGQTRFSFTDPFSNRIEFLQRSL